MLHKIKSALQKIKRLGSEFRSEMEYRAEVRAHQEKLPLLDERDRLILETLKQDGVYISSLEDLDLPGTSDLLKDSRNLLSRMKKASDLKSHLFQRPEIYTVTELPHFYDWGNNQRLLNIIENYLGLPVAFHGVHLRRDFPNQQQFETLQWHWDLEDRKMMKIIIYLSDVTKENGPFEYIPRSLFSLFHSTYYRMRYAFWKAQKSFNLGVNDEILEKIVPKSAWKSCPGPAGTVIFVDTGTVFHHGTLRTQERSAHFYVYTANPPNRPECCTQYWDDTYSKPDLHQEVGLT